MNNQEKYLDIIIRNTEILTEFTELTRRIETIVLSLPNDKDYQKDHESIRNDLDELKLSMAKLIMSHNNSLSLSHMHDLKLNDIPNILNSVDDIDKNTKDVPHEHNTTQGQLNKINTKLDDLSSWAKVKFPFIMGLLNLIVYAIGFYLMSKKITP